MDDASLKPFIRLWKCHPPDHLVASGGAAHREHPSGQDEQIHRHKAVMDGITENAVSAPAQSERGRCGILLLAHAITSSLSSFYDKSSFRKRLQ